MPPLCGARCSSPTRMRKRRPWRRLSASWRTRAFTATRWQATRGPGSRAATTAYWTGKPYLGLGRSAVTMTQNAERRMRVQDGQVVDDLDARQMAAEDLMLGMRMARGVSDEQMEQAAAVIDGTAVGRKGAGLLGRCLDGVQKEAGSVHAAFDSWPSSAWPSTRGPVGCPTDAGWLCGNRLYGHLLDLAVACRCLPPLLVCRLRRDGAFVSTLVPRLLK